MLGVINKVFLMAKDMSEIQKGALLLKQLKGQEIILMWFVPKYSYSLDALSHNMIVCYCYV